MIPTNYFSVPAGFGGGNNNNTSTTTAPGSGLPRPPHNSADASLAFSNGINNNSVSNRSHFQSDMTINRTKDLQYLTAADFQKPANYPSALHVKPPTIAEHQRRPESRWSDGKYCNPNIPSYVPPELMLWQDGRPLESFLQRARLEDMKRLAYNHVEGLFFMRKDGELPEDFRGFPHSELKRLYEEGIIRIEEEKKVIEEALKAAAISGGGSSVAGGGLAAGMVLAKERGLSSKSKYTTDGKIIHRIWLTPIQFGEYRYGAIFGARGANHRHLEKETGCRIFLCGKGITDLKKMRKQDDLEDAKKLMEMDPHVLIHAPTEHALQLAVQKIEFLLSDDPEAVRLRENKTGIETLSVGGTGGGSKLLQQQHQPQQQNAVDDDEDVNALLRSLK